MHWLARIFVTPIAHAQNTTGSGGLAGFMDRFNDVIINPLITVMFVIALMLFLAGMLRFFFTRDQSSEEAKKGKQHMLWGIIGMFIMFSVFGIMGVIKNTLGV